MNIVLVLIFGLLLRLISLNQSFWLDEATSANVAALPLKEIISVFSTQDFHPPFYYLFLHFWRQIFGSGEIVLRLLSVLAGVGTIYTLYLIGKELIDRKVGRVAAILLATSGLHIYYSQEARMYSLAAFFISLTLLFFVKTLKKGRVGEWLLFSFFLVLSVFTDYLPVLIIPGLWLFAWRQKLDRSWWKKFLASHIIMVGTGLLWLPYFLIQLSAGLSVRSHSPAWWQILGQTNFKQLVLVPTKFIFGRINMETNNSQVAFAGIIFLLFIILLAKTLKDFKKAKVIWIWFIVPLILAAFISIWVPVLSYFRFLFVLSAFYLLVSFGLSKFPKTASKLVFTFLIVFNLTTSVIYLLNRENQREDWRALTSFIDRESFGKKSAVVFVADSQQEAYRYYDKDAKILTPSTFVEGYDQLWLMRYVQEIFDPKDSTRKTIEDLDYRMIDHYSFNGVVVWRYQK